MYFVEKMKDLKQKIKMKKEQYEILGKIYPKIDSVIRKEGGSKTQDNLISYLMKDLEDSKEDKEEEQANKEFYQYLEDELFNNKEVNGEGSDEEVEKPPDLKMKSLE